MPIPDMPAEIHSIPNRAICRYQIYPPIYIPYQTVLYADTRYACCNTFHTKPCYIPISDMLCWEQYIHGIHTMLYASKIVYTMVSRYLDYFIAESKVRFPDLSGAKPPCQNILKYWVGNNDNTCMGQLEQLLIRISCYLHVIQINIVAMRHVCPYIYKV